MALFRIEKLTALPGELTAHTVYLIAPPSKPDYVEMYVTGSSPSTVKRIINSDDIEALIQSYLTGFNNIQIVADISARNALNPTSPIMVLVLDASADATVASGAATYVYNPGTSSWVKISEWESLDLSLSWEAISGKPTSTPSEIDDAVSKRHQHANMTQLSKIGEDGNGFLTYNSQYPKIAWDVSSW